MQQYTIISKGYRHFEITNERGQYLGKLEYAKWLPNKANASVGDGGIYEFSPDGFWHRSVIVMRNGISYATLKPQWRGHVAISFENGMSLLLKRKSSWTNSYVLLDAQQEQLAVVQTKFSWSQMGLKYDIEVTKTTGDRNIDELLPFLLIYANKYMQIRHAAVF